MISFNCYYMIGEFHPSAESISLMWTVAPYGTFWVNCDKYID